MDWKKRSSTIAKSNPLEPWFEQALADISEGDFLTDMKNCAFNIVVTEFDIREFFICLGNKVILLREEYLKEKGNKSCQK